MKFAIFSESLEKGLGSVEISGFYYFGNEVGDSGWTFFSEFNGILLEYIIVFLATNFGNT